MPPSMWRWTTERQMLKLILIEKAIKQFLPDAFPSPLRALVSLQQRMFRVWRCRHTTDKEGESEYIDCGFILGSTAIVQSLWSEADELLSSKRRSSMAPITVEMILFLKKNKDLSDITDVHKANLLRPAALKGDDEEKYVQERIEEAKQWMSMMKVVN